jgi:hypothetical protein
VIGTLLAYAPFLAATILVEAALVAALARRAERRRLLAVAAALNLLTHPLATLLRWHLSLGVLPLEFAVVAAEALGWHAVAGLRPARALTFALAANLASAGLGALATGLAG